GIDGAVFFTKLARPRPIDLRPVTSLCESPIVCGYSAIKTDIEQILRMTP
ncbi:MAG: hypothetical protein ACI861_002169, partial [Paracoccaceae bacterium]